MGDLTAYVSLTVIARTVFGNKRVVVADIIVGDGANDWPSGGLPLTPADLGLEAIELLLVDGKQMDYYYDYSGEKIDGYVSHDTPGAAVARIPCIGATIDAETLRVFAVGYGG